MSAAIVVGGGLAGLAAAVDLAAHGLRPTVLEARPHLGGRAYSFTDPTSGLQVDNGQHAMMGCYTHTLAFLERIGAAHKVVRQSNMRVAMRDARLGEGVIACAPLPSPLHVFGGVMGYRLLQLRERCQALVAGLRIARMYRRADPRLAASTVGELLGALGQSAHSQASFWNPIAVATLNEAPARAAAAPFAAVLMRAFFGSRRDSQFVLSGVALSELYAEDARRFIEERGGRIEPHTAVVGLEVAGGDRVTAVRLRDERRLVTNACVVALPPRALAALVPDGLRDSAPFRNLGDFAGSPIVSLHLWLDRTVLMHEFVGLIGTTTQWIFNRSRLLRDAREAGQCLSAVISAGHDVVDWDNARIAATVLDDLRTVVPAARGAHVLHSIVVKERHATISTTPAADRRRPAPATSIGNLWLAGDWTATGLPPTIESAVLSGHRAAALLIERANPGHL